MLIQFGTITKTTTAGTLVSFPIVFQQVFYINIMAEGVNEQNSYCAFSGLYRSSTSEFGFNGGALQINGSVHIADVLTYNFRWLAIGI